MASISKLSIRGVRAFSPDDEEQVISFCFPLTIIVGSNGCGKTTIIESLKYAVTGQMPPGISKGQAFVHDPKSSGQSSCKAQIKLRFTNRAGTSMVVIRSMEVTQARTKLTFKALDGVLRTTHPTTGERISMSHKCTELDRQIPTLLGINKAILEHVVFCHQEESSWPLMEGAVLKKRFDDIFDSTRYAKALVAIKDVRKEKFLDAKELKAELEGLKAHMQAANGFRSELEEAQEQMSTLVGEMDTFDDKIEAEEEKQKTLEAVIANYDDLTERRDEKQKELESDKSVVSRTRNMLERDLISDGEGNTEEDLKKMLSGFDEDLRSDRESLESKEYEMDNIGRKIEANRSEVLKLQSERGRLQSEQQNHEKHVTERKRKVHELGAKYDLDLHGRGSGPGGASVASSVYHGGSSTAGTMMTATQGSMASSGIVIRATADSQVSVGSGTSAPPPPGGPLSEEDVRRFTESVDHRQKVERDNLADMKKRHGREIDEINRECNTLDSRLIAAQDNVKRIQDEISSARSELQSLPTTTAASRLPKTEVDKARRSAADKSDQRDRLSKSVRLKEIPREVKDAEVRIDDLQRSIDADVETMKVLREFSAEENAVKLLQQQEQGETERLAESLQERDEELQDLNFTAATADDLHSLETLVLDIRGRHDEVRTSVRASTLEQTEKQKAVTEKRTLVSHAERNVTSLTNRIVELEGEGRGYREINRVAEEAYHHEIEKEQSTTIQGGWKPEDLVRHFDGRIKDFSAADVDPPESVSRTIQKLENMAAKKNAAGQIEAIICPCCTRAMSAAETTAFQESMGQLKDPNTSELIRADVASVAENRQRKARYEQWRAVVVAGTSEHMERDRVLQEKADLDNTVRQSHTELTALEEQLNVIKGTIETQQITLDRLTALLSDFSRLRDSGNRIGELRNQIADKKESLSVMVPNSDGRALEEVELDVTQRQEQKDKLNKHITRLNKELSDLNNRISVASNQASRAEQLARDKEAQFARQQESIERKNVLTAKTKALKEEEQKLVHEMTPIRQKKEEKEADRNQTRRNQNGREEHLASLVNQLGNDLKELKALTSKIDAYLRSDMQSKLEHLENRVKAIEADTAERNVALEKLRPEIDVLKQQFSRQERKKKIIEDNLELLKLIARVNESENDLADLDEEISAITGYDEAKEGYDESQEKKENLKQQKVRCEGRQEGLKDQIKILKRKLKQDDYDGVDERHRVALIKHETTTMAVSDLDKYHAALDLALMRYHSMKIADINKIIRELWTLTYKGQDIYNIELESGAESNTRSSRSYNYRVVMTKGSTKMDMRGRCSAGQRVLASIVIRLALAETFCLNCGIMCLDEPTTNLDYENKRGLAIALAQIIAARSVQHNFQLVVITHDEDFVAMMKNELSSQTGFDMPERYFHVSREEGADGKYYSKIHAIDWDEI